MNQIEPQQSHEHREEHQLFRQTMQEILHVIKKADTSTAINEGLAKVMSFFDADRVYIGYFNENDLSLTFIHEISSDNKMDLSRFLNTQFLGSNVLYEKDFPWWIGNIRRGIDTIINDVYQDIPESGRVEQSLIIKNGVKSLLTTPIFTEGYICGFMGIEFVGRQHNWIESEVENSHLFSDLFSIFIENQQMQKTIKDSSIETFKNDSIFRTIFETLPVGIELYDGDGYLVNINQYDLDILGAQKENILGINLFDNPTIPEEAFMRIRNGQEAMFENDYSYKTIRRESYFETSHTVEEMRLIGKCIPLKNNEDKIIAFVLLVHHDTTYYQKKEELRDSLTKLTMAINTANAYIWEYDVKSNTVAIDYSLLNREQRKNVETEDVLARKSKEAHLGQIHPEDKERVFRQIQAIIDGEIDSFSETYRQYKEDELRWHTTYFRTYKYDDTDNHPSRLICLTRDITKERENELALINEREANKLKIAFIENMSHELRTPLNTIIGFSNILAETSESEENRYFIDLIKKNNDILLQIIDSILSFTKAEAGDMQYVANEADVRIICEKAIALRSAHQKSHIQFVFDENSPSILLNTDHDRVVQVLFHLIDNAYKFTEEGSVTLRYYLCDDKKVRIEVIDTGIGLTDSEISQIFKNFYKAREFQVGLGLGLCICKKIIEDLGGTLGVQSEKGKGSTFWFEMPLA
ncbi:ATP-binding protein [Parabacteroides sp. PF5-9]|uniref:ATP-binding protein n=1 Tax=Parabacteroides sp. PF5-9 TaxID=1742404 RepID=UPI0024770D2F|nr:ATP-binding protein [Parabacteroides sp. PF5-9]MDH6358654.1 PAS domain S-box-containing protein [Parabacteroides sp. PF5-9]